MTKEASVENIQSAAATFQEEVITGLQERKKRLSPKHFYDAQGAYLFDQITETDDYYLTSAELEILQHHGGDIAEKLGEHCRFIEFGSGSGMKTKYVLDEAYNLHSYVPIDISAPYLSQSIKELKQDYPTLTIEGMCADFTTPISLPESAGHEKKVVFFPGSSFGNFEPMEGELFLKRTAAMLEKGDGLLIGIDLVKNPDILHAAYNDTQGYTAAFNKNILERINREMDADFDLASFEHYAFYQPIEKRIEMHLISQVEQTVQVGPASIPFKEGESIHTENSYKFTVHDFTVLAAKCGFTRDKVWLDTNQHVALLYFERTSNE